MNFRKIPLTTLILLFMPVLAVAQASLNITGGEVNVGEELTVAISLSNNGGQEISGIHLKVGYDSSKLSYVGYQSDETISDTTLVVVNPQSEIVQLSLASTYPVTKSGHVIFLTFTGVERGETVLSIHEYRLNEESIVNPGPEADIIVFPEGGNKAPYVVALPSKIEFEQGSQVSFTVTESVIADNEDDFEDISFTFSVNNENITLKEESVESGYKLTFSSPDFSGLASWKIQAEDPYGAILDTAVVIQVNVPHVNEVPQEIDLPDTLTFIQGEELELVLTEDNISDAEDEFDDLTFSFSVTETGVNVSAEQTDGAQTVTLTSVEFAGSTSLEIDVEDLDGGQLETSIVIVVEAAHVNQDPYIVALPDTLTLFSDDTLEFTLTEDMIADLEDEFDILDFAFEVDAEKVSISFNPETFTLTVITSEFVGFTPLSLTVTDQDGGVLETSIILEIVQKHINKGPFVVGLPDTLSILTGETLSFALDETVIADAEDAFEDLTFSFDADPNSLEISYSAPTSTIQITALDIIGPTALTITVEDSEGEQLIVSIIINVETLDAINDEFGTPTKYQLSQNYPNPFNPSTQIEFNLPQATLVRLEVFDMTGKSVGVLVNGMTGAGSHQISFDASNLSSGIYVYRLQTPEFVTTRKMMLVK